jgi:hypothetical protein
MRVATKSLRALRASQVRLGIERLEDRVIPGETLNVILFWQLGVFPIHELVGMPPIGDESSSPRAARPSRQTDDGAAVRADLQVWSTSLPLSVLATAGDGAKPSEPIRTARVNEDSGVPTDGIQTAPVAWSMDIAQPANRPEPPSDMTAPIPNGSVASSPSVWAPPVQGTLTFPMDAGVNVVPIAPESAIQVAPAAGEAGATPMLHAQPAGNPHGGGGGPAPYSPAQIRRAYGVDQLTNNGAGQTIAIIDAFDAPTISSDLDSFSTKFGLPTTTSALFTFSKVFAQGIQPSANASWAQETSLDVEWAHAIAPQANIMLVETASASAGNLFGGVDYAVSHGAHVVSISWGFNDSLVASSESGWDDHFKVPGVTFLASSGDTGSQVYYPSASPYVVSVGGTSLHLDASGNLTSAGETAWSSGGGGSSVGELEPGYQTAYGIRLSGRGTPDVSYNADPNTGILVYDSTRYLNMVGWLVAGGTSAGAPQWAGLVALANQSRAMPLSGTDVTVSTSPFYTAATGPAYASNYRDITSGSNGHTAGFGYDLATGVGSPLAGSLVPFLTTL